MIEYRCTEPGCKKVLGKIDDDGFLHIDSSRIAFKVVMASGTVICKNIKGHTGAQNKEYQYKRIIGED